MESLKEKTSKGLFWGGMNNLVQQGIGVAFGIILGNLLSPADYGMTSMISVFTLVAIALQNSGFNTALTNLSAPTHRDYNSVFWFNISMGALLYIILFVAAPFIADFYNQPALVPLCRYVFISIPIASFCTAQNAYIFKHLLAKEQAKAAMAATLMSSLVGVSMAFMDFGYWSLATQSIVFVSVNTLLIWHYSPWRPTFSAISFQPVRQMFRFSCKILATTLATIINNNVLNILLGRFFGEVKTGIYNQAYQWNYKTYSLVQNTVNQVAQPVLVDLKQDSERQLAALRKLMRFTAFISFPLMLGFGLIAKEFIVLAITEKWLESASLLQILCISGAILPLCTLLSNMIISKGLSGTYFWGTFALMAVQLLTLVFIYPYGLRTMVVAYVLLNILWLFVWYVLVRKVTPYKLLHFLSDFLPFALTSAGVMVVTHHITAGISSLWFLLLTRVVVAALLYCAIMKAARVEIFDECLIFVKRIFKR